MQAHKADVSSKKNSLSTIQNEKQQLEHLVQITDETLGQNSEELLKMFKTIKSSIPDQHPATVIPGAMEFCPRSLQSIHIGDYQVN